MPLPLVPRLPVRTPRLVLRPLELTDAEDLAAYRSLPEVCRYVPPEPMGVEEVRGRIPGWRRAAFDADGQAMLVAVELVESGRVIGDQMLRLVSERDGIGELGWIQHPEAAHRGLATEAAHALLHVAFDDLGLRRMTARLDARNDASAALCRRLGMRLEAHFIEREWFKGSFGDEFEFGLLAREWWAAHGGKDASAACTGWAPPPTQD